MEKINRSDVTDGLRRQLKNSVGKKKQQFILQQEEKENESDDNEETKSQLLMKKKKYVSPIEKFRPKTKQDKQEKINKHKEAKVEIKEDPSKKNRFDDQVDPLTDIINENITQPTNNTIQEKDINENNDLKEEEVMKESDNSEEELIKGKKEIDNSEKKYSKKTSLHSINDEITLFEDVEGNKKETNTRDIGETFSHTSQQSNNHSEKHKNEKKPRKDGEEKKRKKTKTRSRMKNVKKDKRPDHLKPSYLQNTNNK
ncbi:hypothetical protein ENUP19_0057G0077 [Entamoeba nuttalli]|uniref:Uncharacterized protein n=2 Tax=Entamoeba nuttalli TaxID=412467 RepID=K2GE18_ENTNP|nr:hypothetical protein ENU1_078250 [Entamoeba nuttalli P19]EKE40826.1 hypothetical protein ENU1_078250 [Entamoeba nuttalli P19]|eukprot:XP_008856836.1 hypothetical protein ENU1_078250 [Entamoeba nuttalli P19]